MPPSTILHGIRETQHKFARFARERDITVVKHRSLVMQASSRHHPAIFFHQLLRDGASTVAGLRIL